MQITSPNYVQDRANDLKINKDAAQRLIARYLREHLSPKNANDLSNRICEGILSSMPTPTRPSLRGWRMIPEYPPSESTHQIFADIRALRFQDAEYAIAREVWSIVYRYGQTP